MKKRRGNSEGSIYHMKDGRWRAAVVVKWEINAAGEKKADRKVFTAATRHEVASQLNDALKIKSQGVNIKPKRITVGDFLKSWLETVAKPSVRPKTLRTYADLVKLHITPALGAIQLSKLTPQHVREFQNEALEKLRPSRKKAKEGKEPPPGKPLSPRTVKHLLVTLRTALESAVKDGLIPRNVAAIVDAPSVARPQMKTLSQEQARDFLKAIKGDRLETLFSTAIALAYRQGEALALQWSDVDLEKDTLTVRQSIQRIAGKLTLTPTKKDKIHSLPLPAVTKSALLAHQVRQAEERRIAGAKWQETGFVFTTAIGTPIDARSVIRRFHQILDTSNLPRIRFHDLRHSAATLLLAQGVSPRYISELLGHSQVSFTMQTYAHVLPHVQREAAAKMNEILSSEPVATSDATKPPESSLN